MAVETRITKAFAVMDMKIYEYNLKDFASCTDGKYVYQVIVNSGNLVLQQVGTGMENTKIGVLYK